MPFVIYKTAVRLPESLDPAAVFEEHSGVTDGVI
jgi:hypothetical protein